MALENLKSIFSEGAGNNNSQIRDRYTDTSIYPRPEVEAVNFFGPTNSYFQPLSQPIEGFTLNFNQGGYSVGDGFLGDSKYIPITSNFQTRVVDVDTSNLTSNKLGFGELKSPFENTSIPIDNRFRQGLGFVSETIRSPLGQIAGEVILGQGLLERFTDAVGTAQTGYQIFNSVVNKTFGIDSVQNLIGEISVDGDTVTINSSKSPRYEDTVFENTTNFSLGALSQQNPDNTRGIAFQVAGPNGGDTSPSGRPPAVPPRDLKLRDFPSNTFQDAVQGPSLLEIQFQNPFVNFISGDIEFRTPDLAKEFGSLAKSFGEDVVDIFDDIKLNNIINPDGIFSGFGKNIKKPEWLKDIDNFKSVLAQRAKDALLSAAEPVSSAVSDFAKGITSGISEFASDFVQGPGQVLSGIGIARAIGETASDVFQAINPIEDATFPQIELRNPFASVTTGGRFGGKAKTMGRNPRNLTYEPSLSAQFKSKKPSEQPPNDKEYEVNKNSTPYNRLGKNPYAKATSDNFNAGSNNFRNFYPTLMNPQDGVTRAFGNGDQVTLAPVKKGDTLKDAYPAGAAQRIESSQNGYPLYFKDLREGKYIIFRGYIEGLTENISPSWNTENYIGRSEPTYTYTRAERDIAFSLKLFASTAAELGKIYGKLNQLTSLCYPLYKAGGSGTSLTQKIRMKAPLTKFRLGELFGNSSKELLGFIKSINYTYPDNSPWEFRQNQRVPKHVVANISYQVIHDNVPGHDTLFYGYIGD